MPLGTSALSIPANAKMRNADARVTSPAAGVDSHRRLAPFTAPSPAVASITSGTSFATVDAALSRAPCLTPTTLAAVTIAKVSPSSAQRAAGPESHARSADRGSRSTTLRTNTVDTAATAAVPPSQSSTPVMNPANGPNATSTYAYGPPVSDTRLPASAKQTTISAITPAHT